MKRVVAPHKPPIIPLLVRELKEGLSGAHGWVTSRTINRGNPLLLLRFLESEPGFCLREKIPRQNEFFFMYLRIIFIKDNIQSHQSIQFPKLQSNQEETKETAEEKQWLFGDRSRN